MKKTHYVQGTGKHLCDLCLVKQKKNSSISDDSIDQKVSPLSLLAIQIVKEYTGVFEKFNKSLSSITDLNPS